MTPEKNNWEIQIDDAAQTKDDAWERMLCSMRNADMVENFRPYSKDEINDRYGIL